MKEPQEYSIGDLLIFSYTGDLVRVVGNNFGPRYVSVESIATAWYGTYEKLYVKAHYRKLSDLPLIEKLLLLPKEYNENT